MKVPDSWTSMVGSDAQVRLQLVLDVDGDLLREGQVGAVHDAQGDGHLREGLEAQLGEALGEQRLGAFGVEGRERLALTAERDQSTA